MVDVESDKPFIVREWARIESRDKKDTRLGHFVFIAHKPTHRIIRVIQGPSTEQLEVEEIRKLYGDKTFEATKYYVIDLPPEGASKYEVIISDDYLMPDGRPDLEELKYYMPTVRNWDEVVFEDFRTIE